MTYEQEYSLKNSTSSYLYFYSFAWNLERQKNISSENDKVLYYSLHLRISVAISESKCQPFQIKKEKADIHRGLIPSHLSLTHFFTLKIMSIL